MGIPIHPPRFDSDLLKPFYDGLAAGELRLTFSTTTGEPVWYPPEIVPGDPAAKLEWRKVSPVGTVYSFTTITRSLLPGDHKAEVPFTVVLFCSDDAPHARVPGLFVGEGPTACGMRVRLSPVQAGDHIIAGFAPVE